MYILFASASLKIAKDIIRATGIRECWGPFLEKSQGTIEKRKLLREILGLNVCNLAQAMKETSVEREIDAEDRQDLLDDYIVENLRLQDWITFVDGAERMGTCQEIEAVWERLRPHFSRTREAQGFKPTLEAVRDVMRHLGADDNKPLQAVLLEFFENQHRIFTGYFRGLLEPFSLLEENSKSAPNLLLEPDDPEEPDAPVEPLVAVVQEAPIEPPVVVKPEASLEPPLAVALKAPVEPLAALELKATVEIPRMEAPPAVEPEVSMEKTARAQIPQVEPAPSLEEKETAEPSPEPEGLPVDGIAASDPTKRLSQMPQAEDLPLLEAMGPLSMPETAPPIEPTEEAVPLPALEPLREPVAEKEAESPLPEMVHIERPFPKGPLGSVRDVDPQKLAQVFDILLALDPTADIKPIPPDRFHPPPPPKEPFSPEPGEGPPETPFSTP